MRLTGAVTLLLFLTPAIYVVKYYGVDRPREDKIAEVAALSTSPEPFLKKSQFTVDDLPALQKIVRIQSDPISQIAAIKIMETILLQPAIRWRRPMESMAAKATLAEIASNDPTLRVKEAASEALEKLAEGGAVLQR